MDFTITYPDVRCIYSHPKTREEYLSLYERLFTCIKIKDLTGIKIIANQLLPIEIQENKPQIKYIIEGRKWFDKINGNTYHSVSIIDTATGKNIYNSPMVYGYGSQYQETAKDYLISQKLLKEEDRFNHNLLRNMLYFNVVEVSRKRDL